MIVLSLFLLAPALARTIDIGEVVGREGDTVWVPVMLDAGAAASGLLLRLEYDPGVLEAPTAAQGDLPTPAHLLDAWSPVPGRVNVMAAGLTEAIPFSQAEGLVLRLGFTIKIGASSNQSAVALIGSGTPTQPASSLIDGSGQPLVHSVTPGSVVIDNSPPLDVWVLH